MLLIAIFLSVKGLTVEIGGDTTKLQDALKGVDSQIRTTQSNLRDMNKLLKLDPGNTDLLTQKHRALSDAILQTMEREHYEYDKGYCL